MRTVIWLPPALGHFYANFDTAFWDFMGVFYANYDLAYPPIIQGPVVPVVLLGPEVVRVDHLLEVGSAVVSPVIPRKHSPMSAFCQLGCYLGSQSILYLGFASTATPHIPCH